MMVRLRSCGGWISIRQVLPPILLKLVKARRVRQAANFSIFSSSVNERKGSADNHNGHPWGGERESAKKTGLRLPPPCRGLRDQFPARVGESGSLGDARERSASEPQRERWCWRSDVVQHRPCRTIRGILAHRLDREVDRQPHSSQEDIAMTSAVLVLALGLSGQSPQGRCRQLKAQVRSCPQPRRRQSFACASGPGKVSPAAQAPSKVAPAAQAPSKIAPAPYAPGKVSPAAQAPSKIAPAPYAPGKVSPAAQAPSKIAPAPYAPGKVSPAAQAPSKICPGALCSWQGLARRSGSQQDCPGALCSGQGLARRSGPEQDRSGALCSGQGLARGAGSQQDCPGALRSWQGLARSSGSQQRLPRRLMLLARSRPPRRPRAKLPRRPMLRARSRPPLRLPGKVSPRHLMLPARSRPPLRLPARVCPGTSRSRQGLARPAHGMAQAGRDCGPRRSGFRSRSE